MKKRLRRLFRKRSIDGVLMGDSRGNVYRVFAPAWWQLGRWIWLLVVKLRGWPRPQHFDVPRPKRYVAFYEKGARLPHVPGPDAIVRHH